VVIKKYPIYNDDEVVIGEDGKEKTVMNPSNGSPAVIDIIGESGDYIIDYSYEEPANKKIDRY
jgi:hypothetical protein